jgi:DNA/RNA-binding domain of Phe-tRNA-synthetase-like protein
MQFQIAPAIWERIPNMTLVGLVASELENDTRRASVENFMAQVALSVREELSTQPVAEHPHIKAWRQLMPGKAFRPAHEALRRRIANAGSLPDINPLVNFYNSESALRCVPVGAWDLDALAEHRLNLFVTRGGERFVELGGLSEERALPGEIAYGYDDELVTRHFVWRQADTAKVTNATRRFFMISEILPEAGESAATQVLHELVEGLANHFHVQCSAEILSHGCTTWEVDHVTV